MARFILNSFLIVPFLSWILCSASNTGILLVNNCESEDGPGRCVASSDCCKGVGGLPSQERNNSKNEQRCNEYEICCHMPEPAGSCDVCGRKGIGMAKRLGRHANLFGRSNPHKNFEKSSPNYGIRQARIVGGNDADLHEYCWQVAIVDRHSGLVIGGGALIHQKWVVTVAHKIIDFDSSDFAIVLRVTDFANTEEKTRLATARKIIVHKDFDATTYANNIAVINIADAPCNLEGVCSVCIDDNPLSLMEELSATPEGRGSSVDSFETSQTVPRLFRNLESREKRDIYARQSRSKSAFKMKPIRQFSFGGNSHYNPYSFYNYLRNAKKPTTQRKTQTAAPVKATAKPTVKTTTARPPFYSLFGQNFYQNKAPHVLNFQQLEKPQPPRVRQQPVTEKATTPAPVTPAAKPKAPLTSKQNLFPPYGSAYGRPYAPYSPPSVPSYGNSGAGNMGGSGGNQGSNQEGADRYEECVVTGWGASKAYVVSPCLQEANIDIIEGQDCLASLADAKVYDFSIPPKMFCAKSQGINTCDGDGGSPLVCRRAGTQTWFLKGLVALGVSDCQETQAPTLYVDISQYKDWIETQTYTENGLPQP